MKVYGNMLALPLVKSVNLYPHNLINNTTPQSYGNWGGLYSANHFSINFTGESHKLTIRPPSNEETIKKIDSLYNKYKDQLGEVSIDLINTSIDDIEATTEFHRDEILNGMQQITQFGNIRSLSTIEKSLNENNVGIIANNGNYFSKNNKYDSLKDNTGLNATLNYLMSNKMLSDFHGNNIAIFLDNKKLDDFEKAKETDEKNFNQLIKNPRYKFFLVSGIENGISFLNRSKDLKEETIKILTEAKKFNLPVEKLINKNYIDRANKLGISPIIIQNLHEPTTENIYNQLKPKQILKKDFYDIINATVIHNNSNINNQINSKYIVADYLEKKLDVYSPERISKCLKNTYGQIKETVESQNKAMDDVLYIIPQPNKSYDLINYQYKLINNIPDKQILSFKSYNDLVNFDPKGKIMVILDDCSLSGMSLLNNPEVNYMDLRTRSDSNIILAPIVISEEAEKNIKEEIECANRTGKDFLITNNKVNSEDIPPRYWDVLGITLKDHTHSVIFPYMCPDNNTILGGIIGYYHSILKDKTEKDWQQISFYNIKSLSLASENIIKLLSKLRLKENEVNNE